MIRGYLDVLCAARVGQKYGHTNALGAGNEFVVLGVWMLSTAVWMV